MSSTIRVASSGWLWISSQRGLFWQPQAHQQDQQAQRGTEAEAQPPAEVAAGHAGIEQQHRGHRAQRGADPEGAVDRQVDPAAKARRGEFLDRRVDRRVFAADAGAGEEAKRQEAPQTPGKCRRRGRADVDDQGDEEQFATAQAVGEPAEEQRADHRAGDVGAAGEADVGVAQAQRRAVLQRAGDGAGERHLQAVEQPGDTQRDHQQGVEAPPGQAVQPRRQIGLVDALGVDALGAGLR